MERVRSYFLLLRSCPGHLLTSPLSLRRHQPDTLFIPLILKRVLLRHQRHLRVSLDRSLPLERHTPTPLKDRSRTLGRQLAHLMVLFADVISIFTELPRFPHDLTRLPLASLVLLTVSGINHMLIILFLGHINIALGRRRNIWLLAGRNALAWWSGGVLANN